MPFPDMRFTDPFPSEMVKKQFEKNQISVQLLLYLNFISIISNQVYNYN